jgi:peptidase E
MSLRVGPTLLKALELTKKERPRVCLVLTASGDESLYYSMSYEALNAAGCDVTELKLFPQPSADPRERLLSSDVIWVGGGSVANLLALWRLHGVGGSVRGERVLVHGWNH